MLPRFFTMRLVAPIAAIRGPVVGDDSPAQAIPSPSMIVGIIGAALGLDRREHESLNRIADSIDVAWLVHRAPSVVTDFQTTDLSKPHMRGPMWASDGARLWTVSRAGGDSSRKLVGQRAVTCDVDMTPIISWSLQTPSPEEVLEALDRPRMMLGIGAKWATPAAPIAGRLLEAATLDAALSEAADGRQVVRSYIPVGFSAPSGDVVISVSTRDFRTRRFGGSILYAVR